MISASAMGLIFPNTHEAGVPELVAHRTMASIPFGGRYRMIDFVLSGMANAGIENVGLLTQKNYQSLMDHLGNGREWDLSRKRGGLVIFPPYARDGNELYSSRIEALASVIDYLSSRREELVVMSDSNHAFNLNFKDLLDAHRQSGADVTVLYHRAEVPKGLQRDNVTFVFDGAGRATEIRINDFVGGVRNLSMNLFVLGRTFLIELVKECMVRGDKRFEADYLAPNLGKVKVHGYEFTGYCAHIYNMQSYFAESLRLIDPESLAALFPQERAIYTKVRDEAPVRYAIDSRVHCSLVADGCIIEGEIENCVIFRGVRIGKGAKLKNCVVMQSSWIQPGAVMENVITDKNVIIGESQQLRGAPHFPVFIAKNCVVV
ncbi:MAG: glucose-1-phosphate adenylyltransferase subunit GlgD [Ruminococcaceae bacterium]|nr:glucose-1-phosphate adenylyltransferase subunit GlgD [Oscillospiraceae bacterium]